MVDVNAVDILGDHPSKDFGSCTYSTDTHTNSNVPHRELRIDDSGMVTMTTQLRSVLIKHHASAEMLKRMKRQREQLALLGYQTSVKKIKRFPTADRTQKGNLAEVFLAEYITAVPHMSLPLYRLRYNPNIEQSMKGDDVLVFDFESEPVRIIVGEAKYRATPSKKAVTDIVEGLFKSHQAQIPVSLQFVADRLFEAGNSDLGQKVEDCIYAIIGEKLSLQYVGLLMSTTNAASHINSHTEDKLRNLVMISFGVDQPNNLISNCYHGIEEEC